MSEKSINLSVHEISLLVSSMNVLICFFKVMSIVMRVIFLYHANDFISNLFYFTLIKRIRFLLLLLKHFPSYSNKTK